MFCTENIKFVGRRKYSNTFQRSALYSDRYGSSRVACVLLVQIAAASCVDHLHYANRSAHAVNVREEKNKSKDRENVKWSCAVPVSDRQLHHAPAILRAEVYARARVYQQTNHLKAVIEELLGQVDAVLGIVGAVVPYGLLEEAITRDRERYLSMR
jgi:hypothetical protein